MLEFYHCSETNRGSKSQEPQSSSSSLPSAAATSPPHQRWQRGRGRRCCIRRALMAAVMTLGTVSEGGRRELREREGGGRCKAASRNSHRARMTFSLPPPRRPNRFLMLLGRRKKGFALCALDRPTHVSEFPKPATRVDRYSVV